MATAPSPFLTSEQYLEHDSKAEHRNEYYDGQMHVVEATTIRHSLIQLNLGVFLQPSLRGKSCQAMGSTIRVQIPRGPYYYPDMIVACGKPEVAAYDTLLNPTVIFEILSDSTGDFDRGEKCDMYLTIPSLKEYIVIEQKRARAVRWTRQPEAEKWFVEGFTGLDKVLPVAAIGCEIPLADLYFEVEFDPES